MEDVCSLEKHQGSQFVKWPVPRESFHLLLCHCGEDGVLSMMPRELKMTGAEQGEVAAVVDMSEVRRRHELGERPEVLVSL